MRKTEKMLGIILACVLLFPAWWSGQNQIEPHWETIARIREEGLQRSQVMDIAGYIVDVLGARLTNSEAMKKAQQWAVAKMKEIGLENVVVEPYMDYGVSWDNEYFSLHMLKPDYQPMTGFPLAHTPGTKGKVVCPVVIGDIKLKSQMAQLKGKLKGAVVLSSPPLPITQANLSRGVSRLSDEDLKKLEQDVIPPVRPAPAPPNPDLLTQEEKIAFFKSEGAVAVFQCERGRPGVVVGFSRPGSVKDKWSREKTLDSLPIVAVTPEHYNRMYRIVKRGLPVKVELEIHSKIGKKVEKAANVIGEIPGTDLRDEVVMIGAHFDSWQASPNASDNASGCAVVLEAARILKAIEASPRRTIRVALWSGEEQGLFGSTEYVKKHFGNPKDPANPATREYEKFQVYFNQDYGAGQYRGLYLQGNEHVRRLFQAWMEPFRDFGMTTISIRSVGSTDHVPFDKAGLPAFQFIQDRIAGTAGHTNLDFLDTLSPEDLMKNAVVMAAFAYEAAMTDVKLPRKTLK
ncbi:MAG: M28 family peptidase [Candidatus Aminicenantes bacterium]|nr:M28 family peptidase [Candidatus Aminicenantes bacterium]